MGTTEGKRSVLIAPLPFQCRGSVCHQTETCRKAASCGYRSSADEAREVMKKQQAEAQADGNPFAQLPAHLIEKLKGAAEVLVEPSVTKPSNPKDAIGSDKIPLHLWPESATALGALGLLDGMLKYGRGNFREIGVRASIYQDAARRHLAYWFEGEDNDPDSGLPHLAHALACLAILVDAEAAGKLTDDRQVQGGFRKLMTKLTPHVARLKALHSGKNPKHYTIQDNKGCPHVGCTFPPGHTHPVSGPAAAR